jgi:phosphatidate cytidylyltransferase
MRRIVTAIVALPILLFTIWFPNPYYFVALAALASLIALFEFYLIASKAGAAPHEFVGYVATALIAASFLLDHRPWIVGILAASTMASLALALSRPAEADKSLLSIGATLLGILYVGLLASCLIGVRLVPDTFTQPPTRNLAAKLLTTFFAIVIMTDTGAYYFGRAIGRRKLAPRISPGKTVAGAVGGFICAAATGPLCRLIFFPELPGVHSVLLGASIGIAGQFGDLAESLLKRGAGVKDSGSLLPGHGGMLDRIDSILFCAPILYYYSRLFLSKF